SESIEVVGQHPTDGSASRVGSGAFSEGQAGKVELEAPRIVLDGGALATLAAPLSPVFGGGEGGAGGEIIVNAGREFLVRGGGEVTASTWGPGAAGRIEIHAGESIRVEGSSIESRTGASGSGGDVVLSAPRIEAVGGGEVSGRSAPLKRMPDGTPDFGDAGSIEFLHDVLKEPPETATGEAGNVTLAGETVRLVGGRITTDAGETDGGNIGLQATRLVHLDAGEITASVAGGTGGNIAIDPVFLILQNGSRIRAEAGSGSGGQIRITADNFFQFPGSRVSAQAARPELSGTVEIHSPDVNLAGTLAPLPSAFLDAGSLMRERCAARRSGERAGSF
ncbi:MAG: hypothetical protein L0027_18455, partial [Candidatus Rokubacteria bacterium]|nr:hypothetical protein [Candidatus Rokubacteria bacterium]